MTQVIHARTSRTMTRNRQRFLDRLLRRVGISFRSLQAPRPFMESLEPRTLMSIAPITPPILVNSDETINNIHARVATLQRHGVVRGYQDEVCTGQGKTPPCFGPLDRVKNGQVLLFIARAMVAKGYWTLQADDRTIFPDQNGAPGADPNTDQQTLDHRMVVTYINYVGNPPDVADVRAPFLRAGVAAGGWGDDSSRAWFARAFWPAIQGR